VGGEGVLEPLARLLHQGLGSFQADGAAIGKKSVSQRRISIEHPGRQGLFHPVGMARIHYVGQHRPGFVAAPAIPGQGLAQADCLGWVAVQFSADGSGLAPGTLSAALHPALNTGRWFYGVFQSAPDLIRWLSEPSPDLNASLGAVPLELDRQYRFSAPELKAGSHRLDGVLWPLGSETGSEDLPVVLLEVQMRADIGFHHRLAAQTYRFLQLHPRIELWRVVLITPHLRLQLGPVMPLRGFLEQVHWISLEELGQQENLDAAVDLLTLPVRSEQELGERCRRILASRRDLEPVVFSMLFERFPQLSKEEILMIAGLPLQELRHTRAVQEILEEGRQEGREEGLEAGRQQEAAALAIRQLSRRCGSLDEGSRARLSTLTLQQLEQLAEDLLDFTEPGDLQAWFDDYPAG
jgi:predicted transposase YdaD